MIPEAKMEGEETIPKLIQPRYHKAKVCIWADLSVDDIDHLNESNNPEHIKRVLGEIFGLYGYEENLKLGILMDLYYYTIQFARSKNFTKEQTSAFFSMIKKTHEVCIESPFGNLEHTFAYFKQLLLCHAVNRPPHSLELFSADEVRSISEYTVNTYFRHFKMYKYTFTPLVRLDLAIKYIGIPPTPAPSEVGEPQGDHQEEQDMEETSEALEVEEESEARKELKAMVRTYLQDELKRIKMTVDEQIKVTEESLAKQIESAEQVSRKSPKLSAKGKRK